MDATTGSGGGERGRAAEIVHRDVSLRRANTLRLDVTAAHFAAPRDLDELAAALAHPAATAGLRVLGGGSNMVFTAPRLEGLVLSTANLAAVEIDGARLRVGAGFSLPRLIGRTVRRGLSGLEVLAGIPGTVGGAVAQNAGGRYGEIGDRVRAVTLVTPAGRVERRERDALEFRYRHSGLKGAVVVEVELELEPADREQALVCYRQIIDEKARAQPLGKPSAGCAFKNPEGDAAARLIDVAGLKGRSVGGAVVSPLHANFIINSGDARPADVVELIAQVQAVVNERFGVNLEREVEFW